MAGRIATPAPIAIVQCVSRPVRPPDPVRKAPTGVLQAPGARIPATVVCGRTTLSPIKAEEAGAAGVLVLTDLEPDLGHCMKNADELLSELVSALGQELRSRSRRCSTRPTNMRISVSLGRLRVSVCRPSTIRRPAGRAVVVDRCSPKSYESSRGTGKGGLCRPRSGGSAIPVALRCAPSA